MIKQFVEIIINMIYSRFFAPIPIFQAILLCSHILIGVAAFKIIWSYLKRVHKKTWWDISDEKPNGKLEWKMVSELMENDPIKYKTEWRLITCKRVIPELAVVALLFFAWSFVFVLIATRNELSAKQIQQIGTGIGGIGVFLVFIGVIYTGRVNVRSVNRQVWINDLRDVLSQLLQQIPPYPPDKVSIDLAKKHASQLIFKTELLLNPSEPDHRAMIALLRYFYHINDVKDVDGLARKELRLEEKDLNDNEKFNALKSKLIRLSNVILKREWEQVKHVR